MVNKGRNAIRAEWCKLGKCAKRGFYERAAVELELTQGERRHVNRFLVIARQTTSDESKGSLAKEFWKGGNMCS